MRRHCGDHAGTLLWPRRIVLQPAQQPPPLLVVAQRRIPKQFVQHKSRILPHRPHRPARPRTGGRSRRPVMVSGRSTGRSARAGPAQVPRRVLDASGHHVPSPAILRHPGPLPATTPADVRQAVPPPAGGLRPSTLFSGRTLPSLPTRALICGPAAERRSPPTVFADNPASCAIARSDKCEWDLTICSAAARRSACDSGKPCVTFASTARSNTSSGLPSKNLTSIVSRPCSEAASRRCIPSITRMVRRSTSTGGSCVSIAAKRAIWTLSSPSNRGVSPGRNDEIGTVTASSEAPAPARAPAGAAASSQQTGPDVPVSTQCHGHERFRVTGVSGGGAVACRYGA
jgi:hypothetical protein